MFISLAHAADTAGAQPNASPIPTVVMLVMFAAIFYFMILRPNSKRTKEHRNLIASMQKGDEVMTSSGFVGKIVKISDDNPYLIIALNETNEVTIKKDFITAVLPKGTLNSL